MVRREQLVEVGVNLLGRKTKLCLCVEATIQTFRECAKPQKTSRPAMFSVVNAVWGAEIEFPIEYLVE